MKPEKLRKASKVHRVNISLTDDDLSAEERFKKESAVSRADIFRAGLELLARLRDHERHELLESIRKGRPKTGRPPKKILSER